MVTLITGQHTLMEVDAMPTQDNPRRRCPLATEDNPILVDDAGHVIAYHPSLEEEVHHIILSGNSEGRCDRLIRLCMDLVTVWPTTSLRVTHLHDHKGYLYYRTTSPTRSDAAGTESVLKALWEKYDGCDNVEHMDECIGSFNFRVFARFPVVVFSNDLESPHYEIPL
ncbi:MAG: hypothetical protein IPL47_15010 [Phyllobacteriaceae bacterium]|nr:hypothetical protein [Phyllobacteriaceae bacterium]